MQDGITVHLRQDARHKRRELAMGFADGGLAACLSQYLWRALQSWLRQIEQPTRVSADRAEAWQLAVTAREP